MRLSDLPINEQPREKAVKYGIETLTNAELLAIVLRTGDTDLSVVDFAMDILKKFGGIKGFSKASYQELISIKGVKTAKAMSLLALIEFARRVNLQSYDNESIKSAERVYHLFEPQLRDEFQEKCVAIYLDVKCCLIRAVELFKGGLTNHIVHPRDIFREAVRLNAASIILMHNHPSGDATPSKADIETTKTLVSIGKEIGIPIVDHVIIGKGNYYSLKSNDLM